MGSSAEGTSAWMDGGSRWWYVVVSMMLQSEAAWPLAGLAMIRTSSVAEVAATVLMVAMVVGAVDYLARWVGPGGVAWAGQKQPEVPRTIPGPSGWPLIGSMLSMRGLAHRHLAVAAAEAGAQRLMAMSAGGRRVVVASRPESARELLCGSAFADRPLKQAAELLQFHRAMGFAPYGLYWRSLRRLAATHLFSPRRLESHAPARQLETSLMLRSMISSNIGRDDHEAPAVRLRPFLQHASLNIIMHSVFGRRYDFGSGDAAALAAMVTEGYDLLGSFNWADHLPFLRAFGRFRRLEKRAACLVPKVREFVQSLIDERRRDIDGGLPAADDFLNALLSLDGGEKLQDPDMVSVLWEMVFRGTDTVAILTEWVMAEVILNPHVQRRLHAELDNVVGQGRTVVDADISNLKYLQAVVKETLRTHPPGPLLSWARLAIHDTTVDGHDIPAGTTAMVNMWAITHDPCIWEDPLAFKPERFMAGEDGGVDVDVRGSDLRLAPFGAGRRVCPGRVLGQATVHLWVARMFHHFDWSAISSNPIQLDEVLKLSCEMKTPLVAAAARRIPLDF